MKFFTEISANPGKTVEANLIVLRAKAKVMQRLINEAQMINRWQADGVSSTNMRMMLDKARDANPVINEAQMKAIYGDSYGKLGDPNANTGGGASFEIFKDDTGNMNPVPNR